MNHQQVHQRSFTPNGVGRRRDGRSDAQSWRSGPATARIASPTSNNVANHGFQNQHQSSSSPSPTNSGEDGTENRPLHDRLLFLTMCLIGQFVEVQLKNGSVYSGIFHTAKTEKQFSVVLKMARLVKDGSANGKNDAAAAKDSARKIPMKTFMIEAEDFVQIVAKDVLLNGETVQNGRTKDNRNELVTDSLISQSKRSDSERELKPWKPDAEAPKNLGLDSTFRNTWNRNWDQFETNKTLFGVETTFDEELYTTKLEKGPQTKEREREAWKIAKEIEEQTTRNIHLAEERGLSLDSELENLDEESRYSSVIRNADDFEEDEDIKSVDDCNDETFGANSTESTSPTGRLQRMESPATGDAGTISDDVYRGFHEFKIQENAKWAKRHREEQVNELKSFSESFKERSVKDFDYCLPKASSTAADEGPAAAAADTKPPAAPPASALPTPSLTSSPSSSLASHSRNPSAATTVGSLELSTADEPVSVPAPVPATNATVPVTTAAVPVVSSGATASVSPKSKKSSLNPNAKEFKLNPNAKAFTPSFNLQRDASPPINQNSTPIYIPAAALHPVTPVTPVQALPVMGITHFTQPAPQHYAHYNNSLTVAATVVSSPYIQPTSASAAAYVPQASIKQQAPYAQQQQTIRYIPQAPPVQATPSYHPNAQMYQQQVMYGQPPVVYIQQFPQSLMQGQPVQIPQQHQQHQQQQHQQQQQQQQQQQKIRGNEIYIME